MNRLITESVLAFNIRHPDKVIDAAIVDWETLYAVILAFVRHSLAPGYDDAIRDGANRTLLREEIHLAAKQTYPWLRANADPRHKEPEVGKLRDERIMTRWGEESADLVTLKAQLSERIAELRIKKPEGWEQDVRALKETVAGIDAQDWASFAESSGCVIQGFYGTQRPQFSQESVKIEATSLEETRLLKAQTARKWPSLTIWLSSRYSSGIPATEADSHCYQPLIDITQLHVTARQ
jgi:hypothetical protein